MDKIIINADDLGANDIINAEIEKMIKSGSISSATILANANAFDDVKRIVAAYPHVSFGVHLNLVEFKSLSQSNIFKKYNLTDENQMFVYQEIFKINKFPEELIQAIKTEFREQILKIKNEGIKISHIDGHQHCHAIYHLKDIIKDLGVEFGINKIRRKIPPKSPISHLINFTKRTTIKGERVVAIKKSEEKKKSIVKSFTNYFKKYIHYALWMTEIRRCFIITDSFCSYTDFIKKVENSNVKNDLIELMCHPGLEEFDEETILLKNKQVDKFIKYQLITYNDL